MFPESWLRICYFHLALFPSSTFSMLHFFHVAHFSCCAFFMLYSFHVALFLMLHLFNIEKFWRKKTTDRKHNQKTTLHSALWTCFTFILISYNTFLSLHSLEWLIKSKETNLLSCWKRIYLPRLEPFKTRMWIEIYFSPTWNVLQVI